MRSNVDVNSHSQHSETHGGGCREHALVSSNTVTAIFGEFTGSVVWLMASVNTLSERVDRTIESTVGSVCRFCRFGASDGCRAVFRLRGVPLAFVTHPPTLAGVFRPGLGKYCSRSTGGSRTQ